jgi:hypothetical protein
MTSSRRPGLRPRGRAHDPGGRAAVFLTIALLLIVLSGAIPAVRGAPAGAPSQWSNGVVLCMFNPRVPGAAVSATALNHSGLYAGVGEVEELSPRNVPVAAASVSATNWTVWNASDDDEFDLAYAATAPIRGGAGSFVGTVDLRVDFVLPAYAPSASDNLSSVALRVVIANWTWQAAGDSLALVLPLAPAFGSSEHLEVPPGSPGRVLSAANTSGTPREKFVASLNATANSSGGPARSVAVTPTLYLQPANASITLQFSNSAGSFRSLTYVAQIGILVPATVLGLPWYDYAFVGGTAAAITLAIAAGTRWVRGRPSDLVYAQEVSP